MSLEADYRVGVFSQKMSTTIEQKERSGYRDKFLDSSEGKGLNIVSCSVIDGRKVVLSINRKQLNGVLQARILDKNSMHITVSVRAEKHFVPVIGMRLSRVDGTAVSTIAKNCFFLSQRKRAAPEAPLFHFILTNQPLIAVSSPS